MAKSKYTFGIFIGRFQPLHNAHLKVMLEGLETVNHLIILLGGARAARSARNPFTTAERREMITESLLEAGVDKKRFTILEVQDYYYNENKWLAEVQAQVMQITKGNQDIALLGYKKDNSSYYLMSFPEWTFVPTKVEHELDATMVRKLYFEKEDYEELKETGVTNLQRIENAHVPKPVAKFLRKFKYMNSESPSYLTKGSNGQTKEYENLKEEYEFIKAYKDEQKLYPWPIIFVTVDPIVIRSGHILLVKRGDNPGKGSYALPGGFLNPNEWIIDATLRELQEETNIKLLPGILKESFVETRVFESPNRSQRGRTITHASLFDLGGGQLPTVVGGDDAAEAFWMPLNEVLAHPEKFYEDHWHIIYAFLMRF